MLQPQEVVVAKLLPAIRAKLAQGLIRKYQMKQVDVARAMGITQAAVSHYNTKTRGVDQDILRRFPEIDTFVDRLAAQIHEGLTKSKQIAVLNEFCFNLMQTARFCEYH